MSKTDDMFRDTSDQDMHKSGPAMGRCDNQVDLMLLSVSADLLGGSAHRDLCSERDPAEVNSLNKFAHLFFRYGTRGLGLRLDIIRTVGIRGDELWDIEAVED